MEIQVFLLHSTFEATISNVSVVEVQGDRPRLSYDITNGVVEDKPHLLLEPSSTNKLPYSEDFSQSDWVKGNTSITKNIIKSPDGIVNAHKLVEDSSNSYHKLDDTITVSSGATVTCSVFVKKAERDFILLFESNSADGAYFNLNTGAFVRTDGSPNSYNSENYGNGWYRLSITVTVPSTSCRFQIYVTETSATTVYQGDGSSGVYLWGATVEELSYATSYIPTAGTTITRAAETCNNSKPSVNSTEGVLFVDYASLSNSGNYRLICLSDGTTSNRVFIGFRLDTGYIYYFVIVGGSTVASHITSTTSLDFSKVAVKWKANDFALWINGSEISTDTSGSSFSANTLNTLQMNEGDGAGFEFYGKIKGLAVYNEALSESQLMQLTGVTASSIYSNFVTRTASFTVEALNEVKKVIDNL